MTNIKKMFVLFTESVAFRLLDDLTAPYRYIEYREVLQTLDTTDKVTVQWLKGHSGSLGNYTVYDLARIRAYMRIICQQPIPIPFNEIKSWMKHITFTNHKNHC